MEHEWSDMLDGETVGLDSDGVVYLRDRESQEWFSVGCAPRAGREIIRLSKERSDLRGNIVLHPKDGSPPIKLAPAREGAQIIDALAEREAIVRYLREKAKEEPKGGPFSLPGLRGTRDLLILALAEQIEDGRHQLTLQDPKSPESEPSPPASEDSR